MDYLEGFVAVLIADAIIDDFGGGGEIGGGGGEIGGGGGEIGGGGVATY